MTIIRKQEKNDLLQTMFGEYLSDLDINETALKSGLMKRLSRKMTPMALLSVFTFLGAYPSAAYSTCSSIMAILFHLPVSRQSIWKRVDGTMVKFLQLVLGHLISQTAKKTAAAGMFSYFNRVLVQDSTCIKLPNCLAKAYPGCGNKSSKYTAAMLKVQSIMDLKNESFTSLEITQFRKNDYTASPDVLHLIQPMDLLIRDLGYFILPVLRKLISLNAFFLSRCPYVLSLYLPDNSPLDLLKTLQKKGSLDIMVLAGRDEKLMLRLVALPIPEKIANERRRKLNIHTKSVKGKAPQKKHMRLLKWEIFLTNVTSEIWTAKDISSAYGCRWRIEVIFKTWKSLFNITTLSSAASRYQAESTILGKLIFILCFQKCFWEPLRQTSSEKYCPSLLKTAKVWNENFLIFLLAPDHLVNIIADRSAQATLFLYDTRQRLNFGQICRSLGLV